MEIAREYDITPWEALLKGVRLAAGRVAWVDAQLENSARSQDGDMDSPVIAKWLKESRLERTLMARMAKAAIDGGVAERMVRQVELEGELVAAAVVKALDALDLNADQRTLALEAAHAQLLAADTETTKNSQMFSAHLNDANKEKNGEDNSDVPITPIRPDIDWIPEDNGPDIIEQ